MKLTRRLAAAGLSAAFLAAASMPIMQQTAAANDCPVVEIITAPGSGASRHDKDPYQLNAFNHPRELVNRYPGQVRAWEIPYASSVGVVYSFLTPGLPEYLPYGASVQQGVDRGLSRMQEVKAACPATKFIVTGYSQGGSVAGDITAAVASGQVPGLAPEDLEATYLISDPGRSVVTDEQVTTHTGVVGRRSAAGEVFIDIQQANPGGTVGLTGPRADGTFNAVDRRVMTFCAEGDLACDTDQDGFFMNLGKAMYDWRGTGPAHFGPGLTRDELVQGYGGFLVPIYFAVMLGDEHSVRVLNDMATDNFLNHLPAEKKEAMRELGLELATVARVMNDSPEIPRFDAAVPVSFPGLPHEWTMLIPEEINTQNTKIGRILSHVGSFLSTHPGYFDKWTIDDKSVEQWIIDDASVRIDWWITHS